MSDTIYKLLEKHSQNPFVVEESAIDIMSGWVMPDDFYDDSNCEPMTPSQVWLGDNNIMRKSEEVRDAFSERMKENNPMSRYPERNHTAYPVRVIFDNGTEKCYTHLKEVTHKENIPYVTLKWLIRNDKGSKKHNILKIIKEA
jgi:hypothetical protein